MASDWFGGIGKDLTEFVGEVTKTVQTQVSDLKQANEEEQQSTHEPYGAFANDSVLDSFSTNFNDEDTNNDLAPKKEATPNKKESAQTPETAHLSSPPPSFSAPQTVSMSPNIEALHSSAVETNDDENKLRPSSINNAECAENEANAVDDDKDKKKRGNEEENMKYEYQQLLAEKNHGDAKYKQLKGKFAKLHSKYKQIKEENEALRNKLNEYEADKNVLNESINNKQSKLEQLVKELNDQAMTIEQKDISIQKYESETKTLRNKLDALNAELAQQIALKPDAENNENGASSPSISSTQQMDNLKSKHLEEIANWKLMYEELEKKAFKSGQIETELREEIERLCHNLKLREDQLEKSSAKLSEMMVVDDDAKWRQLIAQKDKEIADIMAEGEDWASSCHKIEGRNKKLVEEVSDLRYGIKGKEDEITSLLQTIENQKTESETIEARNKLLVKHNEDTSLSNVRIMEEMIAIKQKMVAIEAERDEYVEMIENDKRVIKELNICINSEKEEMENYRDGKAKEEHLLNELRELREEMQRIQSMERVKYERLMREKTDEKALRIAAEKRNEELSLEISLTTQPLLRQMESLKTSHMERKKIWDKLESDLRERIRNLENNLNDCDAKMNVICSDLEQCKIKENKIEIVNGRLREENKYFKMKYNEANDKLDEIQMKYDEIANENDIAQNKLIQIQNEKKNIAAELNKISLLNQNERDRLQNILASENQKKQELQKTITILQNKLRHFQTYQINKQKSAASSDINNDNNNNMWTVSRIQNELRQKENELRSLKLRLITLQNTNETFGDEIVKLKSSNEALTKYHILYKNQIKQINALKLRYEAAIDIVIEKEKQIQKLTEL